MRIEQRLFIRNPDHAIAPRGQPSFALSVAGRDNIQAMDAAIDLDDQPRTVADEIDQVGAKRGLPAKMRSAQVDLAQNLPEAFLGSGCVASKPLGRAITSLRRVNGARDACST